MRNVFLPILLGVSCSGFASVAVAAEAPQPVYIVLYTRFYDHSHPQTTNERLERTLPLLESLKKQYPQSGISALFQFSGSVTDVLASEDSNTHLLDRVKTAAQSKLVDVGYTGEDEPSYLYRPKPNLLAAETPEEKWAARAEAADRFLTDFKNPVTGKPMPGLSGGLKRTQEVFGPVAYVSGILDYFGGDSALTYELRKLNPSVVETGIRLNNPKFGIEGYGFSAVQFSKFLSPDRDQSPDVFWEDNLLRLSDASLADNKPHSTDDSIDALKKAFAGLDRTHPRVIKLELASYKQRYLMKRADGSVVNDPMEWLYYHPDNPEIPTNMKFINQQDAVEFGYRNEAAVLKWLLDEFLPANPGSRFISIHELAAMATRTPDQLSSDDLKTLASNIDAQFSAIPMTAPDFNKAGDKYFSLSESFSLFARALAFGASQRDIPFKEALGPMELPNKMGPTVASIPVSDVVKAAKKIALALDKTGFAKLPSNTVPALIDVGSQQVNASQFLRLMAQAYLDPRPDRILKVNACTLSTRIGFMFPKNTNMIDQSNSWTFKPATLHAPPAGSAGAAAQ